jgi:hypothetical protein
MYSGVCLDMWFGRVAAGGNPVLGGFNAHGVTNKNTFSGKLLTEYLF